MSVKQWFKDQFDPNKKIERLEKQAELEKARGLLLHRQVRNKKLRDKLSPPKKDAGFNLPGLADEIVGIDFGGKNFKNGNK